MGEERDAKISAAYRELGAEEPPRALDEAILGAARRSAQPWTKRWAVPLSLAAVVVLSVVVTLRIQHEQPGLEQPVPVRKEESIARQAAEPVKPAEPAARALQQESMVRKEAEAFPRSSQDRAMAENRAAAAAPSAAPATAPAAATHLEAPALAKRADAPPEAGSAAGSVAAPPAPAAAAPAMRAMKRERIAEERTAALTPEKELERIAELRTQGLHDEADKALAEFRKRHPDFKLTETMRERVERR